MTTKGQRPPAYGSATQPIFRRKPGSTDAVLLIHGYTGFPGEMEYVAEALFLAGHTVYAPRLPGHGTDRADFMSTGAHDWILRARDAYIELAAEYDRVSIVGHSMGGAIALILAADFSPDRIALLAPAVDLSIKNIWLAPLVGGVLPVIKVGAPPPPDNAEGERLRIHVEYGSDNLVRQAGQLVRVMHAARAALPRVESRILVITGELDESVPLRAATRISANAKNAAELRFETIKNAEHCFPFLSVGRHDCARLVEEWFKA